MADNLVMEEREESMVSLTGSHPCHRAAHFLRPSVTSIDGPVAAPSLVTSSFPLEYKDLLFNVKLVGGWRIPLEKWKTWVDQMHSSHHSTWKKAGIFDAVMSSKCCIHRHQDLILNFADKWCPTTNTMVFPWGEATITLDDVAVLGGFSVLGESVLAPAPDEESQQTVEKLLAARSDIIRSPAKKAYHSKWMFKFMGGGGEIEHEAFLAYWLSKYVFPFSPDTIVTSVLPIAVRLARGTKIALAPAVLAGIYNNLTMVKVGVADGREVSSRSQTGKYDVPVTAPLSLVQVWVWERFPSLRPKPNFIEQNEPKLARWDKLKKLNIEDISGTIDSAGEEFQWRPYTTMTAGNEVSRMFYKDQEYWAAVAEELDEGLEELVRCVRASELVSLKQDCIEQYLPHRVAMQFGMDQDLPGYVSRVNVNPEVAWRDYIRPVGDAKIYVPPRLFEADVTSRYFKWWKELNPEWRNIIETDMGGRLPEDGFVPPPPVYSLEFQDGENDKFEHTRESYLSSSGDNEKGSCSKDSKRKFVESSSRCNSGVPLSHHDLGKTVAESSSMEIREKNLSQDDDDDDDNGGGVCGLEERVRIIEKLCTLLKSGKIALPLMKKSRQ